MSHYLHEQFEWRMQMPIDEAVQKHPELITYGKYSMQLEPFLDAYGPENILLIFFERFVQQGLEELHRIYQFLGYPGQPQWKQSLEATNVSSQRLRESPLRDSIVNAPILRTIRKRLIPKSWRERVKEFWQIKERPQLSQAFCLSDWKRSSTWIWLGLDAGWTLRYRAVDFMRLHVRLFQHGPAQSNFWYISSFHP